MKRLLLIPFDHLNRDRGVLRAADPKKDTVLLVESARMLQGRPWNKNRLHFLVSSARHFAKEIEGAGFQVLYIKAKDTPSGIEQAKAKTKIDLVVCAEPSSFAQTKQLQSLGSSLFPTTFSNPTGTFYLLGRNPKELRYGKLLSQAAGSPWSAS